MEKKNTKPSNKKNTITYNELGNFLTKTLNKLHKEEVKKLNK